MREKLNQPSCIVGVFRVLAVCIATCMCWGWPAAMPTIRGEEISDSNGTRLRLVPAGRFEMGAGDLSPFFYKDHPPFRSEGDEGPVHPVIITKPFYLATTEVTRGQFQRFVEDAGYVTSSERSSRGIVGWSPHSKGSHPNALVTFKDAPEFTWRRPGFDQADTHPVVGVSFEDAQAYCAWLTKKEGVRYRLPTEAEWEYAARAGTRTEFSFGNVYRGIVHRFANLGNVELERAFPDRVRRQWLVDVERDPEDGSVFTSPVGNREPNAWGLFDVHGNVWEWCEDKYIDTYYDSFSRSGYQDMRKRAIDPLNLKTAINQGDWRVIRGGSWFNSPIQCRSACRGYFEATEGACYLGFRVAREAPLQLASETRSRFERSESAREAIERLVGAFREHRDGRLTLRIRHEQLTDEFFSHLQNLDEPVDVYADGQGRLTGAHIARLCQAPQLRGLMLTGIGPHVVDDDFIALAAHPQLEMLQITGSLQLNDALLNHLAGLSQLEHLHLEGSGITDHGLSRLPRLLQLKALHLAETKSTGALLEKLIGAPLENVSFSSFQDEHANVLRNFPQMTELNLGGSPISKQSMEHIAQLGRLNFLSLFDCRVLTDDAFQCLSSLKSLRQLNIERTQAGDHAAAALVSLNHLTDLRIGGPSLTDEGARKICAMVSLRHLAITSDATAITDGGWTDLWRLRNLETLELHAPRVTGSELRTIEELPKLRWVHLGSPELTDIALVNIARNNHVEQITIGRHRSETPARLTDKGLQALTRVRSLKEINLNRRDTEVSDDGIEKLRKSRPDIQVNVH